MKKIRKMDEMELMNALKVSRLCYVVVLLALVLFDILQEFNVFPKLNDMYLSLLIIIDCIVYLIAILIYEPRKIKEKDEK